MISHDGDDAFVMMCAFQLAENLTCLFQIRQALLIHREEAYGRAVFWTHVGYRSAIRNAQLCYSRTEKFDELVNHSDLPQILYNIYYLSLIY